MRAEALVCPPSPHSYMLPSSLPDSIVLCSKCLFWSTWWQRTGSFSGYLPGFMSAQASMSWPWCLPQILQVKKKFFWNPCFNLHIFSCFSLPSPPCLRPHSRDHGVTLQIHRSCGSRVSRDPAHLLPGGIFYSCPQVRPHCTLVGSLGD